eukprot:scaffold473_cov156-Amphora_coffeaeformis.AAC.7
MGVASFVRQHTECKSYLEPYTGAPTFHYKQTVDSSYGITLGKPGRCDKIQFTSLFPSYPRNK